MIYFTSDEHYGHKNIVRYCNRPFKTVEEMDAEIIKRHNEIVTENDTTYHLGDFTFKDHEHYVKQLNGAHIFIKGNHDRFFIKHNLLDITIKGQPITLCHYPMVVWNRSHYNSWHLFGHVHNSKEFDVGKKYNVGVDANDFYPVSFDTIKRIMSFSKNNFNFIGDKNEKV